MPSGWKKSPSAFAKILEKRKKAVQDAVGASLAEAAELVKKQTDARVFIPRSISKQDAPGGAARQLTGRSPVRTKIETKNRRAIIKLASFYTRARTKGIVSIMSRLGLVNQLFRKSLIVRGRRLSFRTNPRLALWALRPDKGFQVQRHVVRLTSARAREDLVLGPALAASESKVIGVWRRAVKRGLLG